MDFWEWLRQAVRGNGQDLAGSINSVLSRDAQGGTPGYSWPSNLPGASAQNPVVLDPVTVTAQQQGQLPPAVRDLLLSRFTQDTLFPLVGGQPDKTEYRQIAQWPYNQQTNAAVEGEPGTANLILFKRLLDNSQSAVPILTHEGGHMFSTRAVDPQIIDSVKKQWTPEVAKAWGSRARNPEEMFAEAFSRALNFLREADPDIRQTPNPELRYKELDDIRRSYSPPGTDLLVKYLLAQPVFAGHAINEFQLYR